MNNVPTHQPQTTSPFPFEEWMLTAWILGELDELDSNRIQEWVNTHPESAKEIASLRQTLNSVQESMVSPAVALRDSQVEIVEKAIEQVCPPVRSLESVLATHGSRVPWYRGRTFVAACAIAACVPVAFLVRPSLLEDLGIDNNSDSGTSRMGQVVLSAHSEQSDPASKDLSNDTKPTKEVTETSALGDAKPQSLEALNSEAEVLSAPAPTGEPSLDNMGMGMSGGGKKASGKGKGDAKVDSLASNGSYSGEATDDPFVGTEVTVPQRMTDRVSSETANTNVKRLSTLSSEAMPLRKAAPEADTLGYPGSLPASGAGLQGGGGQAMAPGGLGAPGGYGGGMGGGGFGITGGMAGVSGSPMPSQVNEGEARARTANLSVNPSRGGEANEPRAKKAGMGAPGTRDYSTVLPPSAGGGVPGGRSLGIGEPGLVDEAKLRRRLPDELKSNLKMLPPHEVHSADRFDAIVEKGFTEASTEPVTTFSIDVDTAAYSKIRQTIQQRGIIPSPEMVRIEEMVNYFEYEYPSPGEDAPFAAHLKIVPCPWNREHKLVRVGLQAKKLQTENRPRCNLVFLIDVSGSMSEPNKLPLVQRSLSMLASRIRNDDRVAIVVYAGAAGCVLESTPGSEREKILQAINNLQAGGSTNGGQGIQLAYAIAKEQFVPGGANRVVLCTDGDFNVGVTDTNQLVEIMKENAKSNIYLTCLGYGAGNYNDSLMEKISRDGNGLYGMVDNDREAKKLMVEQMMGTLITVAKDVKIQMDFNPELVRSYRLIGYEDRHLSNADFANDKKDAGDIGAGHSVTAFYEIVPSTLREPNLVPKDSESKYRKSVAPASTVPADPVQNSEWLTLKIRAKQPEGSESRLQEFVLPYNSKEEATVDSERDLQWASAVAEFGLLLRRSKMAPHANWDDVLARAAKSSEGNEHRMECLEMMRTARNLANQQAAVSLEQAR